MEKQWRPEAQIRLDHYNKALLREDGSVISLNEKTVKHPAEDEKGEIHHGRKQDIDAR